MVRLEALGKLKKINDFINIRTHNLPASNATFLFLTTIHTQNLKSCHGKVVKAVGIVSVLSAWRRTGIIDAEKQPLQKLAMKMGKGLGKLRTGSADRLLCNEPSGSVI
jgi:hypothetical protein